MTSKRRFALDLSPLRGRDFRLVYTAAGVSSFGSMITYVTIPFQLKQLTGDPLTVGLLGVVELVPLLFMAFVGGALADYLDRRKLVFWAEAGLAALTGLLLLNALVGSPQVWVLFVIAGLAAAVDGVHRPAMDAMMPRLAPAEQMPAVGALNSLRWQIAQIAGPTLAGLMIANLDVAWVFGFDLATFAVSLVCFSLVRAVAPPEAAERPSLRSVVEGIRYARSRPELIGTYLVDINAMFFAFPVALYPWVADKYGGASVLGLFYAALAVGSLLVTVTSGWTARVHRHGLAVLLAAGAWGLGIVLFGLAGSLWLALLGLVVAGASDMISGLFRGVIWNQTIPDHLRGRLAGIEMLSYLTGPMLGQTRAGLSARWWGYSGAVVWGGVLCVAGTGALAAALPAFLRYDGREGLARKQAEEAARAAELAALRAVDAPTAA
ncbi:MFS transporter [Catellatospora chokoriensis]|uniref:MFS transporter n=1 Tax=Catellatospora chokoriensis TaxID=310353 RepID=A0A8J3NR38_9ACTN|nr:MFS transporter [Catellatospora chokoriensis]GIF89141.1 MFS transporter [Catellatospora chokoriensis]